VSGNVRINYKESGKGKWTYGDESARGVLKARNQELDIIGAKTQYDHLGSW
jgi:hypothetical protein